MAKQKSRFPSYGLVRGPSHKHGGVAGVVAGEQPVELEGGEWIIPKEVVPDYLPVLKQITNEGRAIQNMDNGNSAMDALIASASMETGLAKPKSPMYQEGGNVLKLRPTDLSHDEIVQRFQADPLPGSGYKYPFEKEKKYHETGEWWTHEPSTMQLLNWQSSQLPRFGPKKEAEEAYMRGEMRMGSTYKGRKYDVNELYGNAQIRELLEAKEAAEARGEDGTQAVMDYKKNPLGKPLMSSRLIKDMLEDRMWKNFSEQDSRELQAYRREKLPYADVPPALEFKVSPLEKLQHYINKALPKKQGGPVYQKGGNVKFEDYIEEGVSYDPNESSDVYGQFFKDKYGDSPVGLEFAEGYQYNPNLLQKVLDKLPGVGGKRAYQRAADYIRQSQYDPDALEERRKQEEDLYQALGVVEKKYKSKNNKPITNIFKSGMLGYAVDDPRKYAFRLAESEMDKKSKSQLVRGSKAGYTLTEGDVRRAVDPYHTVSSKAGKDILGVIPWGYGAEISKNIGTPAYRDVGKLAEKIQNLEAFDAPAQKHGGPIKQYGHGGQMQPRQQQEMRNPEVYGPPVELMGPAPDTTGNDLQHMLNQLMMRDVNDSIGGPFSQKAALKRAIEAGIIGEGQPLRRKYQEGGMVEQQQAMGPVPQGSLMGAANGDARIRPLTPDTYITKLGEEGSSTMEIPKLSTAYLQSFGMETPLSKQQGASLHQKGITPDTLNPSVTGLINRVLVQRLANEDE